MFQEFLADMDETAMSDILSDIAAGVSFQDLDTTTERKDLFAVQKRKAWDTSVAARCDFKPIIRLTHRGVWFFSIWKKSVKGRTLREIKEDENMVPVFATAISDLITEVLGSELDPSVFAVIAAPRRRHMQRNFGHAIGAEIAKRLNLQFFDDCFLARNHRRITEFIPNNIPPHKHIIAIDDFVTTGMTLGNIYKGLKKYNKNVHFFAGVNNKL